MWVILFDRWLGMAKGEGARMGGGRGGVEFGLAIGVIGSGPTANGCPGWISLPFAPSIGFGAFGMIAGLAILEWSTMTFTWEAD